MMLDMGASAVASCAPMNIALLYGRFCSGGPGAFDVASLYRSKGLTGSESFFFNTAHGFAERGHRVQVFADVVAEDATAAALGGAEALKLESATRLNPDTDVVLAWNEPDLLRLVPSSALRICVQQLNDFNYCGAGFAGYVDVFAFPSEIHRRFMVAEGRLDSNKTVVVPNSINLEFFEGLEDRRRHSVAYCSSPDRGLHWLLEYWPHVRRRVPDATLRVYYKVEPWLNSVRGLWYDQGLQCWYEIGFRARYIEECLRRLGRNGENGVTLVGPTPNVEMARELMRTEVLAYPCDTVRWTEGFSVAIMDACAAGCVPLISDVDAIGQVYGGIAPVIPGRPTSRDQRWIDAIVRGMTDEAFQNEVTHRCRTFAQLQGRQSRAMQWEAIIAAGMLQRRRNAA